MDKTSPGEQLAATLADLISIPSVTGEEEALARHIEDRLRAQSLSVQRDRDGNVTAEVGSGNKTLVINGHMDTVPPTEGWRNDPWTPRRAGDRMHGLGASDMKSGLAVMLHLAATVRPRLRTLFAFTVHEEGGGNHPRNGVATLLKKETPDYAVTCEPGYDEDAGALRIGCGCQGRSLAEIEVLGRAAHSSAVADGDNAIYRALPFVRNIEALGRNYKPHKLHGELSSRPQVSVVMAEAGIARNIIPDRMRLVVDRRLAPGETPTHFEDEIHTALAGIKANVTFKPISLPVVADFDGPLFKTAESVLRGRDGKALPLDYTNGRLDLSYFAKATSQVLNVGPGCKGQAHRADEYASIQGMVQAAEALKTLIEQLS